MSLVTETICGKVRSLTAEFSLGILSSHERADIAAQLQGCDDCRAEIDSMMLIASRLLDLVPGTEPPLGFDRRVLGRLPGRNRRRRTRRRVAVGAAAAATALIFGSLGWVTGHDADGSTRHIVLTAVFHRGDRPVGKVFAYQTQSPWVVMTIRGSSASGIVTCELEYRDRTTMRLGAFELIRGSAWWGAPDPTGFTGVIGVRVVDRDGRVVASAVFPS